MSDLTQKTTLQMKRFPKLFFCLKMEQQKAQQEGRIRPTQHMLEPLPRPTSLLRRIPQCLNLSPGWPSQDNRCPGSHAGAGVEELLHLGPREQADGREVMHVSKGVLLPC
ncbi:hypothetical protein MLD38_031783 [Melastoma candidum]|uniref:Uncharacterized protein n=1 Tax=Melastoma candidum TaxID=119954 RepID=A0ACB9MQC1_9MYRT|nr:hypothetical protein MLD38_031783 [Melastoma candidum]